MNRRIFEILAVVLTGALKFVLVDTLDLQFWFILGASAFWILYVTLRVNRNRAVFAEWGFRAAGFRPSFLMIAFPALTVTAGAAVYGLSKGHLIFNWHILPILLLYPAWGTIQQFLVMALFGDNLLNLKRLTIPLPVVIATTALLFGMVHYPSIPLIVATFFLALGYMYLFSRYRNLWVLGLFHGWLGAIFYFFVLGRDPWLEFIGSM